MYIYIDIHIYDIGDIFDVPSWHGELEGASAVISCLGAFGSNEVRVEKYLFIYYTYMYIYVYIQTY
jgi:hypothetical protein